MGKSRLTLGNGSHCGPFSRMKNTLQLRHTGRNWSSCRGDCCSAKYVRSNASNPGGSAGAGGTGLLFAVSDNNSWTNLSIGDNSGAFAGGKPRESALLVFFLAALHSDQPDCLVYSL